MVGYFLKKQSLLLKGASSILLLVVLFWPVWGNAQDTMNAPLPVPDEAMDTFLLMLALCAIFLMGFIFVVTVALIFITVLILLGMIAAGIVSSAVFVGMYNTDWTNNIVQYRLSPNCTICLIPSAFTTVRFIKYWHII
jgi:glucan phosphoethanolaminetransferase (alkaline phosphatase superfamily)